DLVASRISFGMDAKYAEAPWAVFLLFKFWHYFDDSACSGVLVAKLWVLTAAHCFKNDTTRRLVVRAGNTQVTGRESREIAMVIVYEKYNYSNKTIHDIALVKLSKPFTEIIDNRHYTINPICLPNMNRVNAGQELATLFGFGLTDEFTESRTDWLQRGDLLLQPFYECDYSGYGGFLCSLYATSNRSIPCSGDSGAGLVQYTDKYRTRAILIGIVSSGNSAFSEKGPCNS
ncbi:unnamed protein product, partial [Medioppia subpectinata]